jgi:hypothetical protein
MKHKLCIILFLPLQLNSHKEDPLNHLKPFKISNHQILHNRTLAFLLQKRILNQITSQFKMTIIEQNKLTSRKAYLPSDNLLITLPLIKPILEKKDTNLGFNSLFSWKSKTFSNPTICYLSHNKIV